MWKPEGRTVYIRVEVNFFFIIINIFVLNEAKNAEHFAVVWWWW